jgi:hypothetical protein
MSTCLCTGTPPCWVCAPLAPTPHACTEHNPVCFRCDLSRADTQEDE